MKLIPFLMTVSMLGTCTVQAAPTLPCADTTEYSPLIIQGKLSIPEKVYHYGKKDPMMKNIRARTVPQEDWDRFVMGRGVNGDPGVFGLKPLRRGLYGTDGLDTNGFMHSESRQLMEIHIANFCRDPKYLGSIYALPDDPRFKVWFDSARDLPVQSWEEARQCIPRDLPNFANLLVNPVTPESACEKLINRFLDEADIKIVMDEAIARSLYIRDRNCIETILGTPEEILDILGSNADLWTHSCGGQMAVGAGNNPALLIDALSTISTPVEAETLEKIRALNRTAWYPEKSIDWQPIIAREAVAAIIDSFERCQSKGTLDVFQAYVRERSHGWTEFTVAKRSFLDGLAGMCLH